MKEYKSLGALSPILGLLALALAGCGEIVLAVQQHGYPNIPYEHTNIPPGHLPPPGECRIWFPDRPPGQQSPPGNCDVLSRQVPPGARLIYGR